MVAKKKPAKRHAKRPTAATPAPYRHTIPDSVEAVLQRGAAIRAARDEIDAMIEQVVRRAKVRFADYLGELSQALEWAHQRVAAERYAQERIEKEKEQREHPRPVAPRPATPSQPPPPPRPPAPPPQVKK